MPSLPASLMSHVASWQLRWISSSLSINDICAYNKTYDKTSHKCIMVERGNEPNHSVFKKYLTVPFVLVIHLVFP